MPVIGLITNLRQAQVKILLYSIVKSVFACFCFKVAGRLCFRGLIAAFGDNVLDDFQMNTGAGFRLMSKNVTSARSFT